MKSVLQSKRLDLRWVQLDDASFLYQLMTSQPWLDNIGDRGIKSIDDARCMIEDKMLKHLALYNTGPYLMIDRANYTPLGTVGVYHREGLDVPDIGFALMSAYWNKGFATEAALSLIDESRACGYEMLSAIALPTNSASIKVLTKLGFEYLRQVVLPKDTTSLNYFELSLK